MIAWILSNRWLAEAAGAVILGLILWVLWIEHDHEQQRIGEQECMLKVTETKQEYEARQAQRDKDYEQQTAAASAVHQAEINAIPARVIRTPVWLHDGAICSDPVRDPAPASGAIAQAGGTEPGLGTDIRPRIEAVKAKYEKVIADCRQALADWPAPAP
jgi:hypothetical protein